MKYFFQNIFLKCGISFSKNIFNKTMKKNYVLLHKKYVSRSYFFKFLIKND